MIEQTSPLYMGELIDSLQSYDGDADLKVKVRDEEVEPVNDATVHAYAGDHYEMAFYFTTKAKHGEVIPVREFLEKLEDYSHTSMDDYGGTYWHDSENMVFYAEYGDYGSCDNSLSLRPVRTELDESGSVVIVIDAVKE